MRNLNLEISHMLFFNKELYNFYNVKGVQTGFFIAYNKLICICLFSFRNATNWAYSY